MSDPSLLNQDKKHDIEDHVDELKELDTLRIRSATLRNGGRKFLLSDKPKAHTLAHTIGEKTDVLRALWPSRNWRNVSSAEDTKTKIFLYKIVNQLAGTTIKDIHEDKESTLTAARLLQALVLVPGYAFSSAALSAYYWIAREIYLADEDDWVIGGARASPGDNATAYVTEACVRAAYSFAVALDNTADFLEQLEKYFKDKAHLEAVFDNDPSLPHLLKRWKEIEAKRLDISCDIGLQGFSPKLALNLGNVSGAPLWKDFYKELIKLINEAMGNFQAALDQLTRFREEEELVKTRQEENVLNARDIFDTATDEIKRLSEHIQEFHNKCGGDERLTVLLDHLRSTSERLSIAHPTVSDESHKRFKRAMRSQTAHAIAFTAVRDAVLKVQRVYKYLFGAPGNDGKVGSEIIGFIAEDFRSAAQEIRRLFKPAKAFLLSSLDRQLVAANLGEKQNLQPAELACAAAAYVSMDKGFYPSRVERAVGHLMEAQTDDGSFRPPTTYHRDDHADKGDNEPTYFYAWDSRVLEAFARVLERIRRKDLAASVSKDLAASVKKMLYYFERGHDDKFDGTAGWGDWDLMSNFQGTAQPHHTAAAVQALDALNHMLDERINGIIFDHFRVKMPPDLANVPELDQLFYPDYGLMSRMFLVSEESQSRTREEERIPWPQIRARMNKTDKEEIEERGRLPEYVQREQSVAFTLQRLRAHVTRLVVPPPFDTAIHSVVFHGPSGTGKTTLPESLAKTCNVPLVEVTPSDIIVKGQENVERRARDVFTALALLTRAVVIFDEFDPVVWRRDATAKEITIFTFVTPGMLPKLKDLHSSAKKRSVAYFLMTNLVGRLDPAAIRTGRFDECVGIYPPDVVSRFGRFYDVVSKWEKDKGTVQRPENFAERIFKVLEWTKGGGMEALKEEGWFRPADPKKPPKDYRTTPLYYVLYKSDEIIRAPGEDSLSYVLGEGHEAIKEFIEWQWINALDNQININDAGQVTDLTWFEEKIDISAGKVTFPRVKPRSGSEKN